MIKVNQDANVVRGTLVHQWPDPQWPTETTLVSTPSQGPSPPVHPGPPWMNITLQIWRKQLANRSIVALAFNRGDAMATKAVFSWELLGLPSGRECVVRDLWARKDRGRFVGKFEATVPPHDVVMITVRCGATKTEGGRAASPRTDDSSGSVQRKARI